MASQGEEFLLREDVQQALDGLFETCFAEIGDDHTPGPLPEPAAFLRERGIEPIVDTLRLQHRVETAESESTAKPMAPICDDQGHRGYQQCEWQNGKLHCFWVCP